MHAVLLPTCCGEALRAAACVVGVGAVMHRSSGYVTMREEIRRRYLVHRCLLVAQTCLAVPGAKDI